LCKGKASSHKNIKLRFSKLSLTPPSDILPFLSVYIWQFQIDIHKCHQDNVRKILINVILCAPLTGGQIICMFPNQCPITIKNLPPFFKIVSNSCPFFPGVWRLKRKNHH
jgi:hypothetical protein